MTQAATETRSVVVEREIPHPPEKIWRALTEPHLIAEWLMKNDFEPAVGHGFNLRGDLGGVDCKVLEIEPRKTLSYSWAANGLESVVTWTFRPTSEAQACAWSRWASVRNQEQFYQGAKGGWQKFFANLEQVLSRGD